jgi:hypothetical protein
MEPRWRNDLSILGAYEAEHDDDSDDSEATLP